MPNKAVVMGASAGALKAMSSILPKLPADFGMPVIVVIHLPPDKSSVMPELFQAKCQMKVKEAEDKEPIVAGTIYFAPPDYHLQVEADFHLSLSSEEPVMYSRPSIDILFETAADAYGSDLIGVILTGANDDGAAGLRAVFANGGLGLVQEPDDAYAAAMPLAAIKACPNAQVLSLDGITEYLNKVIQ